MCSLHVTPTPTQTQTIKITIPARCEYITKLSTLNNGTCIVSKQQLAENVYLGEALTEANDSTFLACLVNCNEDDVTLEISPIQIEPTTELEETIYTMYTNIQNSSKLQGTPKQRIQLFHQHLRLVHLNKEIERQYFGTL